MGVLGVLGEDALDAGGVAVVGFGGDDDHGDGVKVGLDRGEGAAVAEADADSAVDGAVADDGLQDALSADALDEALVEPQLADVQIDEQGGRVVVLDDQGGPGRVGGGGHDASCAIGACPCSRSARESAACRAARSIALIDEGSPEGGRDEGFDLASRAPFHRTREIRTIYQGVSWVKGGWGHVTMWAIAVTMWAIAVTMWAMSRKARS